MKKNATKKALLGSILAIMLCLTMLVGTTFAWFTDTASANVNKIQSGNLKVDIVDKDGTSLRDRTLTWETADKRAQEDILWEPGCTYNLTPFKIVNKGNLALKYQITVNGVTGDAKLLEAIDFTAKVGDAEAVKLDTMKGVLLPEGKQKLTDSEEVGTTSLITISGHMKESAGNEYRDLSIENVSITVVATQYTYESDSNNNKYDEMASDGNGGMTNIVATAGELKTKLTAGGDVTVNNDIQTNNSEDTDEAKVIISQTTTLNLSAKIITPNNMGNNNTNFCALIVDADTTINATEKGGIDTGTNGGYGINVRKGATLTINGGSYYGGGTAVQVQEGTLTITGGHFAVEPYSNPTYGYNFLLNCVDKAYKNGTAKIIVKGGTFVNFDPSNNTAEGAGTNFVADGYKVVSTTQSNGDVLYTVVPK